MVTPTAEQLNEFRVGFDRLYGLELVDISDGEVRARVQLREELKQPMGLLHGGVYASIAESMASLATALGVLEQGEAAMGLSNSTSFLRPVTEGAVHAHATRLHRGRTTWVWDVRFSDDAGSTVRGDADDDRRAPRAGGLRRATPPSGLPGPPASAHSRVETIVSAGRAAGVGIWPGRGSRQSPCRAAARGSGAPGCADVVDRHDRLRRRRAPGGDSLA